MFRGLVKKLTGALRQRRLSYRELYDSVRGGANDPLAICLGDQEAIQRGEAFDIRGLAASARQARQANWPGRR